MPDISASFGEIGGVIRTMLGMSRHSRLRDRIRGTVELYELTIPHEALAPASADLAQVINEQASRLVEASSSTERAWNWGAFTVAWMIAGGIGVAEYFLAPHWGVWWTVVLIVVIGVVGALFLIAGLGVLLQRKQD